MVASAHPPKYWRWVCAWTVCSNPQQIERTVDGLAPHSSILLNFRFWAIESWYSGEKASAKVDGIEIWAKTRSSSINCTGWTRYGGAFPNPWNGNSSDHKCFTDVSVLAPHSANSLTLTFGATVNQSVNDESWAVNRIRFDTPPPTPIPSFQDSLPGDSAEWSPAHTPQNTGDGYVHGPFALIPNK